MQKAEGITDLQTLEEKTAYIILIILKNCTKRHIIVRIRESHLNKLNDYIYRKHRTKEI